MLERLWAGWRIAFLEGKNVPDNVPAEAEGTLFERILASDDDEAAAIIHRGTLVSVILNIYPYGSGHMLVVPNRGVEKLSQLSTGESRELWDTVQHAVGVAETVYRPGASWRSQCARSPPCARAAPLGSRYQLHDRHRRNSRLAGAP